MNENNINDATYAELRKIVADLRELVDENEKHLESIDRELSELRENQQEIDNKLSMYGSM